MIFKSCSRNTFDKNLLILVILEEKVRVDFIEWIKSIIKNSWSNKFRYWEYFNKKIDVKSEKVDLLKLINRGDKYGDYAWSVISKIIKYASSLVPGITDKFNDIDEAMRLDLIGLDKFWNAKEIGVSNFLIKLIILKIINF